MTMDKMKNGKRIVVLNKYSLLIFLVTSEAEKEINLIRMWKYEKIFSKLKFMLSKKFPFKFQLLTCLLLSENLSIR